MSSILECSSCEVPTRRHRSLVLPDFVENDRNIRVPSHVESPLSLRRTRRDAPLLVPKRSMRRVAAVGDDSPSLNAERARLSSTSARVSERDPDCRAAAVANPRSHRELRCPSAPGIECRGGGREFDHRETCFSELDDTDVARASVERAMSHREHAASSCHVTVRVGAALLAPGVAVARESMELRIACQRRAAFAWSSQDPPRRCVTANELRARFRYDHCCVACPRASLPRWRSASAASSWVARVRSGLASRR